jgi:hypothetical protein
MKRIPRTVYTLEFKLESVRRVRSGEAAKRVGVAEQMLRN